MADGKATAMSPVNIHALSKSPDVSGGVMVTGATKSPKMPAAGSSPSASQIDGPYGGKKPQG